MYCKIELENYMSHFFVIDYFRYSDIILYGSVYIYGEKITFTSLNYKGYRAVDVYNGIECSTWNRASKF